MGQPPRVSSQFQGTEAECLQQAAVDAGRAAQNGYLPISQVWGGTEAVRELTVVYEFHAVATSPWVTPAAVTAGPAPGWAYVGFWRRCAAALIDGAVLSIPFYALFTMVAGNQIVTLVRRMRPGAVQVDPVTGQLSPINPDTAAAMQQLLGVLVTAWAVLFIAQMLYFVLLWWRFGGTVGQRALGIEIRRTDGGSRIGIWRSAMRCMGYVLSGWALGIGFIWVAFDARKQGWHDKIAGTVAVRRIG